MQGLLSNELLSKCSIWGNIAGGDNFNKKWNIGGGCNSGTAASYNRLNVTGSGWIVAIVNAMYNTQLITKVYIDDALILPRALQSFPICQNGCAFLLIRFEKNFSIYTDSNNTSVMVSYILD